MSQHKLRYSQFWDRINVDSVEEAIGWTPEHTHNDNDIGFCVFPENHSNGDTTGKFAIHRERRIYNCWACGGGSLLSLIMELYGFDVDEATKWLWQFTDGDDRSDGEFVDEFLDAFRDVEKRIESMPYFNERVLADKPHVVFADTEWAQERYVGQETLDKYDVRYVPNMFRAVPKSPKFAEDSDYYGPAVLFPHRWQGTLVGWQCRWLDPERPPWVPKYTMTSDFPKESTLYGWDQLTPKDDLPIFVVESVPSALFLDTCGYSALATFGSSVNDAQMRLLRRLPNGVVLAPDNDPSGEKWLNHLTTYLQRFIPVYHLPTVSDEPGADIGDLAARKSPYEAVKKLMSQISEPGIDL